MARNQKTAAATHTKIRVPLSDVLEAPRDDTQTQTVELAQPTGSGRNIQFSVFLDNRVGRLLSLVEVFEKQPITLAGFSIVESTGHAVVRILTSDAALARKLLFRCEYPFAEAEVLVIQMDGGHTLACVCDALMNAQVSIDYVYPLMVRPQGGPVLALHAQDLRKAYAALIEREFKMLSEKDLV